MEVTDTAPDVVVDESEYVRLLGFPRGYVMEGRARELADWARAWYAAHGRPWIYARAVAHLTVLPGRVEIEGRPFHSRRLEHMLRTAGAHGAVIAAVSAGPELEHAAHEAWLGERPDEYFFLEMFGSAVVEHLIMKTGARLCAWADPQAMAVLPHDSPGYGEWDIQEQLPLSEVFDRRRLPGAIDVLESGMLRPKKTLLAVFGLTRQVDRVQPLSGLVPCESCAFTPCQFRRAPRRRGGVDGPPAVTEAGSQPVTYGTSTRALSRWAAERLTMMNRADGGIDAVFRYEGSTCSNMGRALRFDYHVRLGSRADAYPVRELACRPVDDGFRFMCQYARDGDAFVDAFQNDAPLAGRPLDDVLAWQRPRLGPGCLCDEASRQHKWGLVFETLHYALMHEPQRVPSTRSSATTDDDTVTS